MATAVGITWAVVLSALALSCGAAPSPKALQFIEPKDGFVPVFIRKGDTPLDEINKGLAEAFQAVETKGPPKPVVKHFFFYQPIRIIPVPLRKLTRREKDAAVAAAAVQKAQEQREAQLNEIGTENPKSYHIQIIPRN